MLATQTPTQIKRLLAIVFGVLLRFYIMALLFWKGYQILGRDTYHNIIANILIRSFGIGLIFVSIYLFSNLIAKKVKEKNYYYWGSFGFVAVVAIAVLLFVSAYTSGFAEFWQNIIMVRWWLFGW